MHQRLMSIVARTIPGALSLLMLAPGPQARAALLSPEPAYNARVLRLQYAAQPDERSRMIVTAISPVGGPHIDVYAADQTGSPFRKLGTISDPQFRAGCVQRNLPQVPVVFQLLLRAPSLGERQASGGIRVELDWQRMHDVVRLGAVVVCGAGQRELAAWIPARHA